MEFRDKTLACIECERAFLWSAGEQFFFHERGLRHEPRRCPACRTHARTRRGPGVRSSEHAAPPGAMHVPDAPASPAEAERRATPPATCADCGRPAIVPFRPHRGRPVYCEECFDRRKAVTSV